MAVSYGVRASEAKY